MLLDEKEIRTDDSYCYYIPLRPFEPLPCIRTRNYNLLKFNPEETQNRVTTEEYAHILEKIEGCLVYEERMVQLSVFLVLASWSFMVVGVPILVAVQGKSRFSAFFAAALIPIIISLIFMMFTFVYTAESTEQKVFHLFEEENNEIYNFRGLKWELISRNRIRLVLDYKPKNYYSTFNSALEAKACSP